MVLVAVVGFATVDTLVVGEVAALDAMVGVALVVVMVVRGGVG